MFLVDEKMGAAAVDEDEALLLVFWRLAGEGEAVLFEVDICKDERTSRW